MKKLLLSTAVVAGAMFFGPSAFADVIYTLNTSNDTSVATGSGAGGPGPYAQVDIHLIDATHATALFSSLNSFSFGEMGLDINAVHFGISGLTFTLAPGVTKTPTYTAVMGGKVGSVGNFALDYTDNPNGASDAVSSASFAIHNTSGTWASENVVLNNVVPEAAVHAFWTNGNSFFASGGPSVVCPTCGPGTTGTGIPEPPFSLAFMGLAIFGLGMVQAAKRLA